jgi:hypothetical protein
MKTFFVGLWAKIKSACMGSITMAWSYLVSAFGAFLQNVDSIAAALGDPSLNQQIANVVGDAKMLGRWLLAVGVITTIARLKSLVIAKKG